MIRVMVVDDSIICRVELQRLLQEDGDIEVVGEAANGEEALERIAKLKPDLVTIDLAMPGMGGLALISRLMAKEPLPVLVVTGQPARGASCDVVFEAIRRGALDLAEKPAANDRRAADALRRSVRTLARLPVVRHVAASRVEPQIERIASPRVVAVAASAGGPRALIDLLGLLPRSFPCPVAVVQHLPIGFAASFTAFVRERVSLEVQVVERDTAMHPGTIYLPADNAHIVCRSPQTFGRDNGPQQSGHRPSANALFSSLAETHRSAGVGVILSGMGDDGVNGLRMLKRNGGVVIAQDEASAAVFGMPGAAVAAGIVDHVLSAQAIAPVLMGML